MYIFCNFRTISIILLMVELYVLLLYCRITCIFYYMYCQINVLFCIVQLRVMFSYHLIWCLLLNVALNTINTKSTIVEYLCNFCQIVKFHVICCNCGFIYNNLLLSNCMYQFSNK